jgi:hypothetical protein
MLYYWQTKYTTLIYITFFIFPHKRHFFVHISPSVLEVWIFPCRQHIVVGHFVRSDTGHMMQAIDVTRHSRITQQLVHLPPYSPSSAVPSSHAKNYCSWLSVRPSYNSYFGLLFFLRRNILYWITVHTVCIYVCVLPVAPCEKTDSHDHGMNVMTL